MYRCTNWHVPHPERQQAAHSTLGPVSAAPEIEGLPQQGSPTPAGGDILSKNPAGLICFVDGTSVPNN
jgi:hypothetical protein